MSGKGSRMRRAAVWITMVVLAASIAAAIPASAGALGLNRAKAATARVAARLCDNDPNCVKSAARYCDRQSESKLVCVAFTITRRGTDRVQCRTQVVVTGRPDGTIQTNPRKTRCR
jgi:hypothetical protein